MGQVNFLWQENQCIDLLGFWFPPMSGYPLKIIKSLHRSTCVYFFLLKPLFGGRGSPQLPWIEIPKHRAKYLQGKSFIFFSSQNCFNWKVNHFSFGHVFSWWRRRRRSRRWEKISLSSWIFLASSKTTLLTRMSFEKRVVEKRNR